MSFENGVNYLVHVECVQKPESTADPDSFSQPILAFLERRFLRGVSLPFKFEKSLLAQLDPFIANDIARISAEAPNDENGHVTLQFNSVRFILHIYQLYDSGSVEEALGQPSGDGGLFGESSSGLADAVTAALHWTLPCSEFDGVWESLYYDDSVKEKLLRYAQTALIFADAKVDPTVITMNRVILLHGPPGTGKTSLCKALAQKLAIRLSKRFRRGQLIEINSHSLFSKYFSESGKLVLQMFKKIADFVDDPEAFVCVLIDEVESLTAARRGAMQGNEPSDALRVVNALLTQIDQLKRRSNVLLMATSNLIDAIDAAFIDRADIKLHVDLPSVRATYHVLQSTVEELIRVDILRGSLGGVDATSITESRLQSVSKYHGANKLLEMSKRAADGGISCRTLRKLAFLAYSEMAQLQGIVDSVVPIALEEFLPFLASAVENALKESKEIEKETTTGSKPMKTKNEPPTSLEKENSMDITACESVKAEHVC